MAWARVRECRQKPWAGGSQKPDLAITTASSLGVKNQGVRTLALLVVLAALVSGCGGISHVVTAPPIRPQEWRGVVSDWLDNGRLDGRHSCGAVVVAVAQLRVLERVPTGSPRLSYRRAVAAFDHYAATVCPSKSQLSKIVVGMSDAEVADVAGMPRTPRLRCWLYGVTRTHDGRRVCFVHGRVTLVQISVHG